MSHPKTKKERIISRNKKRDKIKNISKYGYNPYLGWPVYGDKELQDINYIRALRGKSVDEYRNMTGEFANRDYYIRHFSKSKKRKFVKQYANRVTRRKKENGNHCAHKKNFKVWWEIL